MKRFARRHLPRNSAKLVPASFIAPPQSFSSDQCSFAPLTFPPSLAALPLFLNLPPRRSSLQQLPLIQFSIFAPSPPSIGKSNPSETLTAIALKTAPRNGTCRCLTFSYIYLIEQEEGKSYESVEAGNIFRAKISPRGEKVYTAF